MNITVTILAAINSIAYLYPKSDARFVFDLLVPTLLIFTCFILLYSVLRMRATIKKIAYAFPNEKLMLVHIINFLVWCILVGVVIGLGIADRKTSKDVVSGVHNNAMLSYFKLAWWAQLFIFIQNLFALYVAMFLLFLILTSTKEEEQQNQPQDVVLGHKVPLIVFIKNKSMLKNIVTNELCVSEVKKQELRV